MRDKSPTNCDAQLPESNFKTRSRTFSYGEIYSNISTS
ncbi:MAG: DUF6783 domain-containing protein [Clostridiales bacterium]|nr:DUF6783 domain-containing protein [Clostridiales bacterium]